MTAYMLLGNERSYRSDITVQLAFLAVKCALFILTDEKYEF